MTNNLWKNEEKIVEIAFWIKKQSASRFGKDAICNRITDIFKLIDFKHININDHLLRINLKKSFFKSWLMILFFDNR